jgi:hypothetical protein
MTSADDEVSVEKVHAQSIAFSQKAVLSTGFGIDALALMRIAPARFRAPVRSYCRDSSTENSPL